MKVIFLERGCEVQEVVSHKLNEIMSTKAFYKLKNAVLMCVIIKILGAWK